MRKICSFLFIVMMLSTSILTAYAEEAELELYHQPIAEAVKKNPDALGEIETEILAQAQAVLQAESMSGAEPFANTFDIAKAAKMALVGNDKIVEEISVARDVSLFNLYFENPETFQSRFLNYCWKVPVAETETGYVYATVQVNSPDDVVISTTIVGNKELSDATYLFDQELIPNILKESGMNVRYDTVLPVTVPTISTDMILFVVDETTYGIVLSARPDLLGVENGKIYEYSELERKVDNLLLEISPGYTSAIRPTGGGGGWLSPEQEPKEPLTIPTHYFWGAVALVVGIIAFFFHMKKRATNR